MSEKGSAQRRSTTCSCTLMQGGVTDSRGPPPEGAVWDPIWDLLWDPLWDPIWNPLSDPLGDPSCDLMWGPVWYPIWDPLWGRPQMEPVPHGTAPAQIASEWGRPHRAPRL